MGHSVTGAKGLQDVLSLVTGHHEILWRFDLRLASTFDGVTMFATHAPEFA